MKSYGGEGEREDKCTANKDKHQPPSGKTALPIMLCVSQTGGVSAPAQSRSANDMRWVSTSDSVRILQETTAERRSVTFVGVPRLTLPLTR